MPAATTLGYAGWAFFGVLVRGLQLGIQQRPFSHYKLGYVYSAAFWSGFGYYFYRWVDTTDEILDSRVDQLHQARARRQARLNEKAATSTE